MFHVKHLLHFKRRKGLRRIELRKKLIIFEAGKG